MKPQFKVPFGTRDIGSGELYDWPQIGLREEWSILPLPPKSLKFIHCTKEASKLI